MSMKTVNLICIGCPLGCPLTVEMEGKEVKTVTGNTCPRGVAYAQKELTNPTRIVTSTVRVAGGKLAMVSVKTQNDIPKDKIFELMAILRAATAKAPVCIGQVLIPDVFGTDIVATAAVQ